jgi:hypothetical protein
MNDGGASNAPAGPANLVVTNASPKKPSWRDAVFKAPEVVFAFDTVRKVFVFSVIALSALGLHKLIEVMEEAHSPTAITMALSWVEYAILVLDILWIAKYLVTKLFHELLEIIGAVWLSIIGALVVFGLGMWLRPYVTTFALGALRTLKELLP